MTREVKKPEVRRQEIVEAAQALFNAKHYDNTTIQDVMGKVGVAKGTIYHYFSSKEDLLEAVIEESVKTYIAQMRSILENTAGSGLDKLKALITSGDASEEQQAILDAMHRPGNVGMHTRQLAQTVAQLAPIYAEAIQQGIEEGIFQSENPLETAEFLLSAIQFLTDLGFHPWPAEDLIRRIQAFPAIVEKQLGATAGSFNFLLEQI